MTVKELKDQLNQMPDNADVILIDTTLYGSNVSHIKFDKNTKHELGVVKIFSA